MRQAWNSLDKIIVAALCERDGISPVDFHREYKVSPISIFESVDRLGNFGIASIQGGKIVRTEQFQERVIALRHQIYHRPMPWKRG